MFSRLLTSGKTPIGLDLGAHGLRLLQLVRRGEGWGVAAAAWAPLPADMPADGPVRTAALAELLRQAWRQGGFAGRRVVSILPAESLQYRISRLPRMPAEELKAAVDWEAADRSPNGKDVVAQYYDAGEVRQGEEVRQEVILMVAAAPAVQQHVATLRQAGLTPLAIDAVPSALGRALAADASDDSPRFVLDVGYRSTKALILRAGRVLFFKPIDVAGRKLDETVAGKLNLPLSDAADLRRKHARTLAAQGGAGPMLLGAGRRESIDRAVLEALRPVLLDLAREVGLCLRYYSVTFRGQRPAGILLAGGEATDPTLVKILAEESGLGVVPANPLPQASSAELALLAGDHPAAWAVAAGLAQREAARAQKRRAA